MTTDTQMAIDALRLQVELARRSPYGGNATDRAAELAVACNLANEPLPIDLPEVEMIAGEVPEEANDDDA